MPVPPAESMGISSMPSSVADAERSSTPRRRIKWRLFLAEGVPGRLDPQKFKEFVSLGVVTLASRKGNSQGQYLGVFQLIWRQFEEERGCFGEIIKFKGSFDGCEAGLNPL